MPYNIVAMTPTTKYMELLKAAEDLVYSSRSAARTYHRWGREDAVKELRQIEELGRGGHSLREGREAEGPLL